MVENEFTDPDVNIVQIDQSVIEAQTRAEIDTQVATAKQYPRSLKKVLDNCITAVSMDMDMAKSCKYSISRGGKAIVGPTVHLAKLIVSQYGNVRVSGRVVSNDGKTITSEGMCFDLENNVAFKTEVKRRITDKNGKTFSEDMQVVTGNAANSIAQRNAIFSTIPKFIVDRILKEVDAKIDGKLSDNGTFLLERAQCFSYLKTNQGLSEERILNGVGAKTIEGITKEQLKLLIAIVQSIKDGDSTVEESFPLTKEDEQALYEKRLKDKKEAEEKKTA